MIYSYLVFVGIFPNTKKYFHWWKTFLPIFQVVQFAMILIHAFQLIFKNECGFPMTFVYFIGGHGALFYFILMYELVSIKINIKNSFLDNLILCFRNGAKTNQSRKAVSKKLSNQVRKIFCKTNTPRIKCHLMSCLKTMILYLTTIALSAF